LFFTHSISLQTPIYYSNVRLVDPVTKAPVRVAWRYLEDGSKVRVTRGAKASGSVLPRPEILAQRRVPLPLAGGKDTATAAAAAITHVPGSLPSLLRRGLSTWRGFAAGGG
jgi:Ribosomal proteins 50S L24/mitochondrial 39S L24